MADTTNASNCQPIRNIAAAQRAGFHGPLCIPVAPPDANGIAEKSKGKCPAIIRSDGTWQGLHDWTHGTSAAAREQCDRAGANCGLLTGLPNDHQQFLAIDCDFDGSDTELLLQARALTLETIVKAVGRPIWVRDTRPLRAAVLIRIPHEQAAGKKGTYELSHADRQDLGKIELLAGKNHIVISGTHPSKRRIQWWRTDAPDDKFPVPTVDSGIPTLKDRQATNQLLDRILEALGTLGITHTRSKSETDDRPFNSTQQCAEDQAPPSAALLISTLQRMPNPASTGRDTYVSVMNGVAGCIRAGKQLNRIGVDEERQIVAEAAKWAARWEAPNASTAPIEEAKLRSDFLRQPNVHAGWRTIVNAADAVGVPILDELADEPFAVFDDPVEAGEVSEPASEPSKSAQAWNKPVIQITKGNLPQIVTAGEDALIGSGLPIFQRGGVLVRPCTQKVPANDGRTTLVTMFHELKVYAVLDLLAQCAVWEKANGRRREVETVDPSKEIAEVLLSRKGLWRFPSVVAIIGAPTIRPDGSILSAAGYDEQTWLFNAGYDVVLSETVEAPDKHDAEQALAYLNNLLSEFPFAEEMETEGEDEKRPNSVDRSVALSAMLSSIACGAVPKAPLHGFNANTAGSGKTELTDLVSAGATGQICPASSVGPDRAELEKRLTAALLSGHQIINLDNCNGEIGGNLLCQALSASMVRLRRLTTSDDYDVHARAFITATGNGLIYEDDVVRRCIKCNLDPRVERPELRNFKQRPIALVLSDRSAYVSACITIVRAYMLAGRPSRMEPKLAGFESWSDNVRSALVWLGCEDPLKSMERARNEDPVLNALRDVILFWPETMRAEGHTVAELIAEAQSRKDDCFERNHEAWYTALLQVGGKNGLFDPTRLGKWLSRFSGRVVSELRIAKDISEGHGGGKRWLIEQMR